MLGVLVATECRAGCVGQRDRDRRRHDPVVRAQPALGVGQDRASGRCSARSARSASCRSPVSACRRSPSAAAASWADERGRRRHRAHARGRRRQRRRLRLVVDRAVRDPRPHPVPPDGTPGARRFGAGAAAVGLPPSRVIRPRPNRVCGRISAPPTTEDPNMTLRLRLVIAISLLVTVGLGDLRRRHVLPLLALAVRTARRPAPRLRRRWSSRSCANSAGLQPTFGGGNGPRRLERTVARRRR